MAKITNLKIEISDFNNIELRIDWDNDMHQALPLTSLNPRDVANTLRDASNSIRSLTINELI